MKKLVSLLLAVMMFTTLAAGCGSTNENKTSVKITYKSLAWLKAEQDVTKQIIDTWNKKHPEIQVEYVQGDWGTLDQELLTTFETGDVFDIFQYWVPPIFDWKEKGFLADLTPMLDDKAKKDVLPDVWKLITSKDGKIAALPFQNETDVIFYNKALFKEAGIEVPTVQNPWDLEDLVANAKKLTKPDKGIYGLFIPMHFAAHSINSTWAPKIGVSPVIKEDDRYVVKLTDEYKALVKRLHDVIYVDNVSPKQVEGYDYNAAFLAGQVAIVTGVGCWMRSQIINENNDKIIDWGILPSVKLKTSDTFASIQTLSISEKSKHKAEAMEFLKYFWNVENQAKIAQSAFIFPGRISATNRPEFKTTEFGWDVASEGAKHITVPLNYMVPGWAQFMNGTGLTIYQEYMNDKISLDEFVRKVELEGTKALTEAAK